jgi:hypothetical protein
MATPPPQGEEGGQLGGACCYYVHLKFQLLQNAAPLPKAHKIEIEVAFRDHNNCKLSCVVPLFVSIYKPFSSQYMQLVYLLKDFDLNIVERKLKNWSPSMQGT